MPIGFGNYHQSEAISGALPLHQNSPQECPFGLYAEQLSGTAFTRPRALNLRSWLYRILPSVKQQDYSPYDHMWRMNQKIPQPPNPMRWFPFSAPQKPVDWMDSLFHIAGNNASNLFLYHCNQSMHQRYFSNYDGELLFIPYLGELLLRTEFGDMRIEPGKIAVIPRGVKFQVRLDSIPETASTKIAAGYVCENLKTPFSLPNLGLIGSNGLANPRHFLYPEASYEDTHEDGLLICKYEQNLWKAHIGHSPLNVVAWHGNYAPYTYDLSLFNTINSVSFDHPDPSIFTLLTSESTTPGVANLDFVIFPPRWIVTEHTFRPPYFHRNIMNELMGLITGEYDAKKEGFLPGGISIHNAMTAHGPDANIYEHAIVDALVPTHYENTMAFMLEAKNPWEVTEQALKHPQREAAYSDCWQDLKKYFKAAG